MSLYYDIEILEICEAESCMEKCIIFCFKHTLSTGDCNYVSLKQVWGNWLGNPPVAQI
jgi:hypothetical protein